MSEVPRNVPAMTDSDLKPTDHVYNGIASIRGWDSALAKAHRWEGSYQWRVGRILSAILLAGGEDRVPVAIGGELDSSGTGHLGLLYPDVIVIVRTSELTPDGGSSTVTVHPLSAIQNVHLTADHSYYNATTEQSRESGMEAQISVDGQHIVFPPRTYNATDATSDTSAAAAIALLRRQLGGLAARV